LAPHLGSFQPLHALHPLDPKARRREGFATLRASSVKSVANHSSPNPPPFTSPGNAQPFEASLWTAYDLARFFCGLFVLDVCRRRRPLTVFCNLYFALRSFPPSLRRRDAVFHFETPYTGPCILGSPAPSSLLRPLRPLWILQRVQALAHGSGSPEDVHRSARWAGCITWGRAGLGRQSAVGEAWPRLEACAIHTIRLGEGERLRREI
jgi:hypothetical protein